MTQSIHWVMISTRNLCVYIHIYACAYIQSTQTPWTSLLQTDKLISWHKTMNKNFAGHTPDPEARTWDFWDPWIDSRANFFHKKRERENMMPPRDLIWLWLHNDRLKAYTVLTLGCLFGYLLEQASLYYPVRLFFFANINVRQSLHDQASMAFIFPRT